MGMKEYYAAVQQQLNEASAPPSPVAPEFPKRTVLGTLGDVGVGALKAAVALPESVVGLADLATGGYAGKALEEVGFAPTKTQNILNTWYSEPQQAAMKKVAEAEGFVPTLKAAIENPSTIVQTLGESSSMLLGGGGVARGLAKLTPKLAGYAGAAIGEGALTAGQMAESVRQETPDKLLTPSQSTLIAGSGGLTALINLLGGRIAKGFGIANPDELIAGGVTRNTAETLAGKVLEKNQKNVVRRIAEAGLLEGVFEEMPQSAQEAIATNIATGQPWDKDLSNQAAMGLLAGGIMGGGASVYSAKSDAKAGEQAAAVLSQPAPATLTPEQQGAYRNARIQAAASIASYINKAEGVQGAENWLKNATYAIENNLPLQLNRTALQAMTEAVSEPTAREAEVVQTPATEPAYTTTPEQAAIDQAWEQEAQRVAEQEEYGRAVATGEVIPGAPSFRGLAATPQAQPATDNLGRILAEQRAEFAPSEYSRFGEFSTQSEEMRQGTEPQLRGRAAIPQAPAKPNTIPQIKQEIAAAAPRLAPTVSSTALPEVSTATQAVRDAGNRVGSIVDAARAAGITKSQDVVKLAKDMGYPMRVLSADIKTLGLSKPSDLLKLEVQNAIEQERGAELQGTVSQEQAISEAGGQASTEQRADSRNRVEQEAQKIDGRQALVERRKVVKAILDAHTAGTDVLTEDDLEGYSAEYEDLRREISGFNDRFSRNEATAGTGTKAKQVQQWLGNIPNVIVLDDFTTLFKDPKDQNAEAVARRATGKIYVNASKMKSAQHARDIVFDHELRHFGLSKMFGGSAPLAKEMEKAFKGREAEVIAFALERGYTRSVAEATEEYIVSKAREAKEQGFLGKVVATLRGWARANGFGALSYSNAEILKMVRESGTVIGVGSELSGDDRFAAAWHGSPYTFEKFSTSAIGTGEGAQAYGYGLYFAGAREVAEWYREQLSDISKVNPNNEAEEIVLDQFKKATKELKAIPALNDMKDWLSRDIDGVDAWTLQDAAEELYTRAQGRLYKVELAPAEDEYLLWDKPLSEQSEKVREALRQAYDNLGYSDLKKALRLTWQGPDAGYELYKDLSNLFEGDKSASEYLHSLGIRGIKYLDGNSRNRPMKDIKKAFLSVLPEDAEFSDVMELVGSGRFSPEQETLLKALEADDWLGFDYPAQAISAALGNDLTGFDPSNALSAAVAELAKDQQFNYVIFSDQDVEITDRFSRGEINDFTTRVLEEARRADEGSTLSDATKELARVLGPEFYDRPSATARATKAAERSFLRKWAQQRGLIQDPTEFNTKWTTELGEDGKPIQGNEHDVTFNAGIVTKRNRMPNNYHESYAELFDRVAIFNWLFGSEPRLNLTGFQEVDGVLMPVFTQKDLGGTVARIEDTENFLSEAFEPVGTKTASFRLKGSDIIITDVFGNNTRKVGDQVVPMDYVVFHGKRANDYLAYQEAQQREINEALDEEEFDKQFEELMGGDRFARGARVASDYVVTPEDLDRYSRPFNKQEAMDEIKSYGPSLLRLLSRFSSWLQPLNRRYDSLQYANSLTDEIKDVVRQMAEQSNMQRSEQNRVLSTTKEATDQWMKAGKAGDDLPQSMELAFNASLLQLYPGKSMVDQGWGDTPEAASKAWNKAVGAKQGKDFATEYSRITREFNALSPATRKAYLGVVDVMSDLRTQLHDAYLNTIDAMPVEEEKKRELRRTLERNFRNLKGAYMPFTRHGEYVANVYDKTADGKLINSTRAATMGELRAQVELLKAQYPADRYEVRKFDGRVIHKAKENRISPALLEQMKGMLVDNLNQAGFSKVHRLAKQFLEDNVEQLSDDQRDLVKAIYKAGNLKSQAAAINALRDNVIDSYELVDFIQTMDTARERLTDNPGLTKAIDDLEQIFLDTLPDTSALKSSMHRKGTAGWSSDAIRSVLDYANRYGKSLAYMKHGRQVDQLEAEASRLAEGIINPDRSLKAQTLLKDTFENRRVVSEEEVGALGKFSTKLGSLWFLTSPSMILVQNSQPWAITVPYLAARYGLGDAVSAMTRNHVTYQLGGKFTDDKINAFDADLIRAPKDWNTNLPFSLSRFYAAANGETKAKILKSLTADEKNMLALRLGMDTGVIANSMSFEAVEYARKGASGQIGTALDTAAEKAYFFQRFGETLSRKGAYMAAFELATKAGDSFDEANRKAIRAVNETLYDYSATNRPRIISGTFGRFFGQFRTYQLQTWGHMLNLFAKGRTGDKAAVKELGLLMATNFVLAGATGLPLAGSLATMLGAVGFLMGEDDDWVKEIEEELLKTKAGQVVLKGAPMILGLDLSRRIGMEGLTHIFQGEAPAKATPKDQMNFYASQILGPAYAASAGAAFNIGQAIQDGDWGKAFEQGTPRAIASAFQAMKLNNKGLTDGSGRVIIPEDKISKWDVALMMIGVNPGQVSVAREKEKNIREVTDMVDLKKQRLAKDLERAVLDNDGAAIEKSQAAIQRFNQQYPMFGFTSQALASRLRGAWQERAGITSRKYQAAELYLDRYDEEEEA